MLERIAKVFASVFAFPADKVTQATGPDDVPRWDSLGHMRLVAALQAEFKVEFELDETMQMVSVARIAEFLKKKGISE